MYTFLFVANVADESPDDLLGYCAQITQRWMPSLGVRMSKGFTLFPEFNGGWFWLAPECTGSYSLISEANGDQYAVLVFGDLLGSSYTSTAQTILNVWVSDGANGVRALEGCFSAVIVDRSDGSVTLISDILGQRTLRYYNSGQTLFVSPHEAPLAATGHIPVEFDYVSAASIAGVGWSLRGRSLLKHLLTCHPAEYIKWSDGKIQIIPDPIINTDERIAACDSKAISRHLDQMLEVAQANMTAIVANEPEIKISLSAGFDSRAVMSLLLSVVDPSQIVAFTVGEFNDLDVQVARQLAKTHRIRFSSEAPPPPYSDDFVAFCDFLAFSVNGDVSSKSATIQSLPNFEPNQKPLLCGAGGEIFRGYYYPRMSFSSRPNLSPIDAVNILTNQYLNSRLPWNSLDLMKAVDNRLNSIIKEYTKFSTNGYDILDLFYLYERFAIWGGKSRRQPCQAHRLSPFFGRQLTQLAYIMPSPIADQARIHQESIRRFAPKAYWAPINGKQLLPLQGREPIVRWLGGIYQGTRSRIQHIKNRVQTAKPRGIEQLRADAMTGPLKTTVHDILMSKHSFALEIFDKDWIESLLNAHNLGLKNVNTLGCLITMERWRNMINEVARESTGARQGLRR
ncbi:MAG: hypothetical protein MJA27_35760 [Pseudanabaenales cyanobacterium]|nr:hypothetical protein [Pseudanabaenales cyanobacterium]